MLAMAIVSCGPSTQAVGPSHNAATSPLPSPTAVLRPPSTVLQATVAPWQLPTPLSRMVVLADGSRLLIAGGLDSSGASSRTVLAADPATGRLTSYGTLASGVHDAGGAVVSGVGYVFGGGNSASTSVVQALQPGTVARLAGNLPTARADLSVAAAGPEAIVVGGLNGTSPARTVLATHDGSTFRPVAELASPVRYAAVAVVGDFLYVFGGEWSASPFTAIERITLSSGKVDVVGKLPQGLSHAVAITLGGEIWLLGGLSQGHTSAQILRFDPGSATVSNAGTLPEAVSDAGVAVVNGTGYLIGGETSGATTNRVVELRASQ